MNQTRHINLWTSITLVLLASLVLPWTAFAAVWTDKLDYSPGETVTILGDNSDGAGYMPGETVHVDVVGPNGYTAMCDGVAADDSNAAWSCQVILWDTDLAYGTYYYTATGLTSGVVEEGSFTDAPKIDSYLASDCNTGSDSFILGDEVCAKAYGLARNASGAIKWWAPGLDVNTEDPTRDIDFGPVNGTTSDQYVPAACGTWTIRVYSPANTTKPASDTFQVTQPPSAVFSWSPEPQDEGSPVQFTDESIDCDGPIVGWSWDFGGMGTSSEQNPSFTFLDNGVYNVCLTVTDSTGDTDQVCHDATVLNVAPEVTIASPEDYAVLAITSGVSLNYGWIDPGVLDTFVCTVDWGDGTVETLPCTSPQTAPHDYTPVGAGLWPIVVTVEDDDGGVGQASIIVVVYDPDAGFVTGGGWINSPADAYTPDPSLTGKATFGFVSKYHKGASVPVGETEFQFHVAGFNFHSDAYQWLIVNQDGTNAQYKGTGAINGVGGYTFMIWGGDGAVDTFRIKIWEGEDEVIYDNGFDQPIASGNIIVHTGKK